MDELKNEDGGKGQEEVIEKTLTTDTSKDEGKETVEVGKEDKVESIAKEEYDKVVKEAEEAKTKLAEMSSSQLEVEKTKNDLVSKVVSALGIGEIKKPEEDIEALVQDEDKLYKHLQKSGYKGLVDGMRTLARKDAQGIVQSILTNLSANATLYSEYPELKDEKSELSLKVAETMKSYRLPDNIDGKKVAAKMAKLELGAMKVAQDVAGAVDDAKKGIQDKTDKTHVEINKKGITSMSKTELTSEQKKIAEKFGLTEKEYATTMTKAKVNAKGHKTYSYEDMIEKEEK
jgi:hypothetical protein